MTADGKREARREFDAALAARAALDTERHLIGWCRILREEAKKSALLMDARARVDGSPEGA